MRQQVQRKNVRQRDEADIETEKDRSLDTETEGGAKTEKIITRPTVTCSRYDAPNSRMSSCHA